MRSGDTIVFPFYITADGLNIYINGKHLTSYDLSFLTAGLEIPLEGPQKIVLHYTYRPIEAFLPYSSIQNCTKKGVEYISVIRDKAVYYEALDGAVACSGYVFKDLSLDNSWLFLFRGSNLVGRSIKVFINDIGNNIFTQSFILPPKRNYTVLYSFPSYTLPLSDYAINWETRSYGKKSANILSGIYAVPFPTKQLGSSYFRPLSNRKDLVHNNTIYTKAIIKNNKILGNPAFRYYNLSCPSSNTFTKNDCYLSINQSYDSSWVAISLFPKKEVLSGYRLNSWEATWVFSPNHSDYIILVLYLPELFSILLLVVFWVFFLYWLIPSIVKNGF